ncbi:MAG: preprotein translocase subunit SecY [Gemmatimonadales bacterium]
MTAPKMPNFRLPPELKEKALFTLMCLAIYRFGAHIATPGVNVQVLADFMANQSQTLFGVYDMFVGGGLSRATVLALGIMPYISASIVFQLSGAVFPTIDKLQKEEDGRKKITQWTRYLTVALAMGQGYSFGVFTESLSGAVAAPGIGFRLMTTVTLTTGAMFIMWLGEQITERGIGNGMSLMIFFSIMEGMLPGFFQTLQSVDAGVLTVPQLLVLAVMMLVVVAGVIAMTIAARRIPIQIPRKVMGRGRIREGQKSFIPIRINSAGVMPIIFAQSLIVVPGTLAAFTTIPWLRGLADTFAPNTWPYYITYSLLIVFFTYFYTSIIFNPVDLAENLKKQGGFIPGVKPGALTADYIDDVLSRVTLPGSVFLVLIALLPFWVFDWFNVPFFFGGTALLIVVGVGLDTWIQIQQHAQLRHYDDFMKQGRVKFRGRRRFM